MTVDGAKRSIIGGTNQIMLSFGESNAIGAGAGCNHLGGTFRVEGSTLRVDNIAVTTMGCDPASTDQDAFVFGFLTSSPSFTVAGTRLVLTSGSTVFAFVESS